LLVFTPPAVGPMGYSRWRRDPALCRITAQALAGCL